MAKNSKVKKSDSIDWDYSVALESTDHISISQEKLRHHICREWAWDQAGPDDWGHPA